MDDRWVGILIDREQAFVQPPFGNTYHGAQMSVMLAMVPQRFSTNTIGYCDEVREDCSLQVTNLVQAVVSALMGAPKFVGLCHTWGCAPTYPGS